MTHKDHIHAASLDDFYLYTVREWKEPEVLYSLFFETEDGIDFMGTYAPDEIKKATPHDTYSFEMKIIFLYLRHKIVLQVEGESDLSQGNYFNHPSLDEDDTKDTEYLNNMNQYIMESKDYIHYAKHPSGAYMYTVKTSWGLDLVYVKNDLERASWPVTMTQLKQGDVYYRMENEKWDNYARVFKELLKEISAQANGEANISSKDHFNHPSTDEKTFIDKFRERIDKTKEVPIKTLLWLDDLRNPYSEEHIHKMPPGNYIKFWVENYEEFVQHIKKHGLPSVVSFDHDLAREHYVPVNLWDDYQASKEYQESQTYTEKTGLDCAEWLVNFCKDNNLNLPEWYVHTDNPVGADKIELTLKMKSPIGKAKDEPTLKPTKEEREDKNSPSFVVRKDIKVTDERTSETMIAKKLPDATGYNIYYSEKPFGLKEVIIGEYIENKWGPVGNKQVYNYELLNELLNQIESEIMQNKRPTTKKEREAEKMPHQDAYETGYIDGKRKGEKDKQDYLYTITLEAYRQDVLASKVINTGKATVVKETNDPAAGNLLEEFFDAMQGVGFAEATVQDSVIEFADEYYQLRQKEEEEEEEIKFDGGAPF